MFEDPKDKTPSEKQAPAAPSGESQTPARKSSDEDYTFTDWAAI